MHHHPQRQRNTAFPLHVRNIRQIVRFKQLGLQYVELVYEELQHIAAQCGLTELMRFSNL